ncbi:unnamed protein product [Leptosia nina]|uniref:receptor protein-tyrosine kinase n=1 Tax=Leptosia nina TaxID=320188 RepID=A0AAV1JXK0_9NEOP
MSCAFVGANVLEELPATPEQMKDLASSVCLDMFTESRTAAKKCTETFQSRRYEADVAPPAVQVLCQSENKVTFSVPLSKDGQLVVVIPDEDDFMDYLSFRLMEPAEEIGAAYTPSSSFTLWTSLVNEDGSHSRWRRGPSLPPWSTTLANREEKNYTVKHKFLYEKYNATEFIEVVLSWNNSDASDSCFDVYNRCNNLAQGDISTWKIRPFQNRSVIALVPLDDQCTLKVRGKYGTTDFIYDTPSCYDLPGCKPLPEIVQNLRLTAVPSDKGNGFWIVQAKWNSTVQPPSYYTVTLRADAIYTVNVSRLLNEATFTDVQGEGLFNVTVVALNDYGRAVSTRRGIFPQIKDTASMSSLVGAWAGILIMSTAFVIVFIWWKRQRDIKKRNMYFPGIRQKIAKDGEIEVSSVDSGSEDQWEVKPERLLLHEVIGEGAFGVVRRGTLSPENKDVAVKMLKDFPSVEEIRSFRAEMELMKSVGCHPHVVSLVGCCRGRKPFIIAEYCSRGDLLTYLRCSWDLMITRRNAKYYNNNDDYRKLKGKRDTSLVINRLYDLQAICDTELTFLDLLSFCRQIAMGMEFLASNRVVHRDLAARNILVTIDRTLKIADFGLSRDIYQENQYKQKGNGKMPVKWMALESLTHRIYTTQSDVWSFGVVMWEIVTMGGAPYPAVGASRLPRLLRAGYRMPRPSNCSGQLYELMLSCWHERPRSRPTFGELHHALDALLCASAHHYLDLQLPLAPEQMDQRYVRMIIRGKWPWSNRGYQRSYTTNYTPRTEYKLANS